MTYYASDCTIVVGTCIVTYFFCYEYFSETYHFEDFLFSPAKYFSFVSEKCVNDAVINRKKIPKKKLLDLSKNSRSIIKYVY